MVNALILTEKSLIRKPIPSYKNFQRISRVSEKCPSFYYLIIGPSSLIRNYPTSSSCGYLDFDYLE